MTALTVLRSVSGLHLPDFFCIMNTGEFQGLKDSIICRLLSCSLVSVKPPVFLVLEATALSTQKAMAPYSSTIAWKIPWTEEPGGLQSMASLGVGHD